MGYANSSKSSQTRIQSRHVSVSSGAHYDCPAFLDLMAGEKIVYVAHPTWLNYLFLLLLGGLFLLVACGLILAICSSDSKDLIALSPLIATFSFSGIAIILYAIINVIANVAIVTSSRVITKKGLISTSLSEVRIPDIRGMNRSRGIWQAIIGVDNVCIGTAATGGTEIKIIGIRNAKALVDLINSMRPVS